MDLIDRKELIKQIKLQANRSSLGETVCRELSFGEMAGLIIDAPTVDAVLVVRCEDCHHAHKYKHESPYVYCMHHGMTKYQNDFCSNGINENKEIQICLTEDCPYQKGNPCEAWETCGGFEGKEN